MYDNLCEECQKGSFEKKTLEKVYFHYLGKVYEVPNVEVHVCNNCGAKSFSKEAIEQEIAYAKSQHKHLEVNPEEIKNLRKSLGMSQKSFSRLIGCGQASLQRWERGLSKPGRTYDLFIRLVRESVTPSPH
jgi:putative zinc finger/helix-turn-helix YgiT family protein